MLFIIILMGLTDVVTKELARLKTWIHEKFVVMTKELAKIRKMMEELEIQDPHVNQKMDE
jgi:hypothetical protein